MQFNANVPGCMEGMSGSEPVSGQFMQLRGLGSACATLSACVSSTRNVGQRGSLELTCSHPTVLCHSRESFRVTSGWPKVLLGPLKISQDEGFTIIL